MHLHLNYLYDRLEVLNGLAEFTRFWIVTRHYDIKGDLYQATNPSSIHGLYTDHDDQYGWNRYVHGGYFMLFDLQHFWLHPDAQDYLYTILRSGYDVEQRWQEQGVVNMMMLLFISSDHKMVFSQVDIQLSQGILEMVANCTSVKVLTCDDISGSSHSSCVNHDCDSDDNHDDDDR